MSDNLQRYVPEFDDDEARAKLAAFSKEELLEMLIRSYKTSRVWAKMLDESQKRLGRIQAIFEEPSELSKMPDIPGLDDIRRMME